MNNKNKIITRFAPSPTGKLHIGIVRTALFNYLFAQKNNGKFIIRIEDTDKNRSKIEFEKDIFDGLVWLGLSSSNKEIFRQSNRYKIYKKYLDKLIKDNLAYKCFCSIDELEKTKQNQRKMGLSLIYSGNCSNLKTEKNLKNYVIRLRVNSIIQKKKEIIFNDLIRGDLITKIKLIGDFIIAKVQQGEIFPLYNFVVVVDDYEMKVSHIIRGEDHIPNTPKQILIQKALNLFIPKYAHLPLILGTDKSKMSKRSGAVSVISYKDDGYLPEALINFIALLGWNPKNEREFFTIQELIKEFSIEKIQKSGAIFNVKKLDYINGYYIRKKSLNELTNLCIPYLIQTNLISTILVDKKDSQKFTVNETKEIINFSYLEKIIGIYQERLKKLSEISELTNYFFKDKLNYEKDMFFWKNMTYENLIQCLKFTEKIIYDRIKEEDFNQEKIRQVFFKVIPIFNQSIKLPNQELNRGYILWPFRVALTAKKTSSGPFEIAEILGKKETIKRINNALYFLK